ncbi:MAG: hypothetical protein WCO06_06165 [Candidatus Roizmanbacteria bacterium]
MDPNSLLRTIFMVVVMLFIVVGIPLIWYFSTKTKTFARLSKHVGKQLLILTGIYWLLLLFEAYSSDQDISGFFLYPILLAIVLTIFFNRKHVAKSIGLDYDKMISNVTHIIKSVGLFISILLVVLIILIVAFAFYGWVSSLSLTTIIIILLVLLLFK